MSTYFENVVERTIIKPDGSEEVQRTVSTKEAIKSDQGRYIKLYTEMWCTFNGIPLRWQPLFLQLACHMQYPSNLTACKPEEVQLVNTYGAYGEQICNALGFKKNSLQKGLKALCDCGALKRISLGVYQINPSYAVIGNYSTSDGKKCLQQLKATFDFVEGSSHTKVVVEDDSTMDEEAFCFDGADYMDNNDYMGYDDETLI